MSWFQSLISGGVDKIVDSVGSAIDRVVTSDHERLQMQNELAKIQLDAARDAQRMELEADAKVEDEITKRWQADSQSDDPWAKKVRPFSLIYMIVVTTLLAVMDGNAWGFTVKDAYIDLFQALLMLAFGAYFGSRGLEKIYQIKGKRS
jgi:hypothetical protein